MELDCDATNSKAKKNVITSNASIKGQLGQGKLFWSNWIFNGSQEVHTT